jgi:hypothetical protein
MTSSSSTASPATLRWGEVNSHADPPTPRRSSACAGFLRQDVRASSPVRSRQIIQRTPSQPWPLHAAGLARPVSDPPHEHHRRRISELTRVVRAVTRG